MSQHAVPVQKAAAWLNYQVEREGVARLTIFILLLTTVGMLSYTWGYAEVSPTTGGEGSTSVRPAQHLPTAAHCPSLSQLTLLP